MTKEFDNELEPMNILEPDFNERALLTLISNPDKVLPVYNEDPEVDPARQDFFLHLVKEDRKIYVQAEDFSTKSLEIAFLVNISDNWHIIQPGIYRLDVTKYLKGVI